MFSSAQIFLRIPENGIAGLRGMYTFNFDSGKLFFEIIFICNSNTMCESSLCLHSKHLVFLSSNFCQFEKHIGVSWF